MLLLSRQHTSPFSYDALSDSMFFLKAYDWFNQLRHWSLSLYSKNLWGTEGRWIVNEIRIYRIVISLKFALLINERLIENHDRFAVTHLKSHKDNLWEELPFKNIMNRIPLIIHNITYHEIAELRLSNFIGGKRFSETSSRPWYDTLSVFLVSVWLCWGFCFLGNGAIRGWAIHWTKILVWIIRLG